MSDFQIFSDGACDIPIEEIQSLGIKTIPFYISFNSMDYFKEIEELSLEKFYNTILNKKIYPKTSLPSVEDYINAFTPYLQQDKGIVCFTLTNTLSGSVQSAQTAKSILLETFPDAKIFIINSYLATGAQGMLVKEAVKMQQDNLTIEEVYENCEKLKHTGRIIFMVGTLDYLKHGGRIGKIASISGSMLNLKPIILLENAEIGVAGIARGRKKGIQKLATLCKEHFEKIGEKMEDYTFEYGISNDFSECAILTDELQKLIPNFKAPDSFQIGATITSHTGPDTIGLCFIKSYKSL